MGCHTGVTGVTGCKRCHRCHKVSQGIAGVTGVTRCHKVSQGVIGVTGDRYTHLNPLHSDPPFARLLLEHIQDLHGHSFSGGCVEEQDGKDVKLRSCDIFSVLRVTK